MINENLPVKVAFVTPTYSGDLLAIQRLCESIDQHVSNDVTHYVLVPKGEVPLFSGLANSTRQVLAKEDILNSTFYSLNGITRALSAVGGPQKELWLNKTSLKARGGWYVQQLIKLSSTSFTDADVIVSVDSDVEFVRPVNAQTFFEGKKLKSFRVPSERSHHREWKETAATLLGSPRHITEYDYVNSLVPLHKSILFALRAEIEMLSGTDWLSAISFRKDFSEFMLYGVFSELNSNASEALLSWTERSLVHSLWTEQESEEQFLSGLQPWHIAIHIQSRLRFSSERRGDLIRRAMQNG